MPAARSQTTRSRVMIVDDHPLVRHGLAWLIGEDPSFEVCAEAGSVEEALRLLPSARPDVIVLDITLGSASGLELIKQVKSMAPQVRMLVNSMHEERLYAERALRAGAMGYVCKQAALPSVLEALRQVIRGVIYVSPGMADRVLHRVIHGGEPPDTSPVDRLSDRELEVFTLIGAGLTTRQVAERLHLSPKTIETHRDHIKAKLNITNNNELVRQAVEWSLQNA